MRQVRARSIFFESPLPRDSWNRAEPEAEDDGHQHGDDEQFCEIHARIIGVGHSPTGSKLALRFAPRWYFILLTAVAVPGFIALGFWQWHRGEHRTRSLAAVRAQRCGCHRGQCRDAWPTCRHLRACAFPDSSTPQRQILLDNISHDGQPGYEALAVLRLADGSGLLVNRGWLPFAGYRDQLPDVAFRGHRNCKCDGPAIHPARAWHCLGSAAACDVRRPWPRVTSFPEHADIESALGEKLLPPVLLLGCRPPAPVIFAPGRRREFRRIAISATHSSGGCSRCWRWACLLD